MTDRISREAAINAAIDASGGAPAACSREDVLARVKAALRSLPPVAVEGDYEAAAVAYAEAWAAKVNADSITPRDDYAQMEREEAKDILYQAGVRFMKARAIVEAFLGTKIVEPTPAPPAEVVVCEGRVRAAGVYLYVTPDNGGPLIDFDLTTATAHLNGHRVQVVVRKVTP